MKLNFFSNKEFLCFFFWSIDLFGRLFEVDGWGSLYPQYHDWSWMCYYCLCLWRLFSDSSVFFLVFDQKDVANFQGPFLVAGCFRLWKIVGLGSFQFLWGVHVFLWLLFWGTWCVWFDGSGSQEFSLLYFWGPQNSVDVYTLECFCVFPALFVVFLGQSCPLLSIFSKLQIVCFSWATGLFISLSVVEFHAWWGSRSPIKYICKRFQVPSEPTLTLIGKK